jgi:hypothetical protein
VVLGEAVVLPTANLEGRTVAQPLGATLVTTEPVALPLADADRAGQPAALADRTTLATGLDNPERREVAAGLGPTVRTETVSVPAETVLTEGVEGGVTPLRAASALAIVVPTSLTTDVEPPLAQERRAGTGIRVARGSLIPGPDTSPDAVFVARPLAAEGPNREERGRVIRLLRPGIEAGLGPDVGSPGIVASARSFDGVFRLYRAAPDQTRIDSLFTAA